MMIFQKNAYAQEENDPEYRGDKDDVHTIKNR